MALAKEGNSLGAHAEAQRLQSEFNDIRCLSVLVLVFFHGLVEAKIDMFRNPVLGNQLRLRET